VHPGIDEHLGDREDAVAPSVAAEIGRTVAQSERVAPQCGTRQTDARCGRADGVGRIVAQVHRRHAL
jgi:hypothetical protein